MGAAGVASLAVTFVFAGTAFAVGTPPSPCDPDIDPTCVPDCVQRYEVLVGKGVLGVTKLVGELQTPKGLEKCVPNDNYAGGV